MLNWLNGRLSVFIFQTKLFFSSHFGTECIYKKWFLIWCFLFLFSIQIFNLDLVIYTEQFNEANWMHFSFRMKRRRSKNNVKKYVCWFWSEYLTDMFWLLFIQIFHSLNSDLIRPFIYIWSEVWIEDFTVKIWRLKIRRDI